MSPLLVLDTNVVRGARDDSVYKALRAKGFRLAITAGVVSELLARARRGANDDGPTPGLFYGPARRLAPHLDGACPVLPTTESLRAVVIAGGDAGEKILFKEVTELRGGWELLLRADEARLIEVAGEADVWLGGLSDFSTRVNVLREKARGQNWRDYLEEAFAVFDTDPLITERFHAMVSFQAVCCAKTATGEIRVRAENDTQDLLLLGQVGLGAFVATGDRRLLDNVHDSGTYQAPWIRTVDEYLAAERLPTCRPWGDEARREAELFAAELREAGAA